MLTFVATNTRLLWQNTSFAAKKVCLSWQNTPFVMTKVWQTGIWAHLSLLERIKGAQGRSIRFGRGRVELLEGIKGVFHHPSHQVWHRAPPAAAASGCAWLRCGGGGGGGKVCPADQQVHVAGEKVFAALCPFTTQGEIPQLVCHHVRLWVLVGVDVVDVEEVHPTTATITHFLAVPSGRRLSEVRVKEVGISPLLVLRVKLGTEEVRCRSFGGGVGVICLAADAVPGESCEVIFISWQVLQQPHLKRGVILSPLESSSKTPTWNGKTWTSRSCQVIFVPWKFLQQPQQQSNVNKCVEWKCTRALGADSTAPSTDLN